MNIVIAIDSFKGSIRSIEAGKCAANGIRKVYPDAIITVQPLADGGEGTVDALTSGCNGTFMHACVTGPLGSPVDCVYGMLPESKTAIIEMAGAAGLTLVPDSKRNPLYTTTYGVGEIIKDAIRNGCRHFIIGIGGSATNDGGIGMLQALGFDLTDALGKPISFGAIGLKQLSSISNVHALPELKECTFRIACDVTNPLCGPNGCSSVFAPQKGANAEIITAMDTWLSCYAALAQKIYPKADSTFPGSGAAGGLGFAFRTFLNASLESGIQIVLEETNLADAVRSADIVVTGEGRLDGQTVMGKAPIGVARIAKKYQKPVIAFAGCVTADAAACNAAGIDAFFPILQCPTSLAEAMNTDFTKENITRTVEQVFRLIAATGSPFH